MQIACRIHACAYPRKGRKGEKRKEPGARKKRANRLRQRWDSGYAFYSLPFLLSFSVRFFFFFFSFFSRDDVIARWSAGCYVIRRENRSCGGKGEFAKGEGSFCEWKKRKEEEKEKKDRMETSSSSFRNEYLINKTWCKDRSRLIASRTR